MTNDEQGGPANSPTSDCELKCEDARAEFRLFIDNSGSVFEFEPQILLSTVADNLKKQQDTKPEKVSLVEAIKRTRKNLELVTTIDEVSSVINELQEIKQEIGELTHRDQQACLFDIAKVYDHAPLSVRFDFLTLLMSCLSFFAQLRLDIEVRRECAYFCVDGLWFLCGYVEGLCHPLHEVSESLSIATNICKAFDAFAQRDLQVLKSFVCRLIEATYALVRAAEQSIHFYTIRYAVENQLEVHVFYVKTMAMKYLKASVEWKNEKCPFDMSFGVAPCCSIWDEIHELLRCLGSFLKMPEPAPASHLLQRIMGSINFRTHVFDDPVSPTGVKFCDNQFPERSSERFCGIVSPEEAIMDGVRIKRGVYIPVNKLVGSTEKISETHEHPLKRAPGLLTRSWYVKPCSFEPYPLEHYKRTRRSIDMKKNMLQMHERFTGPLSKVNIFVALPDLLEPVASVTGLP